MQTVIKTRSEFKEDLSEEKGEYNIDHIMKGKDQQTFYKDTINKMIPKVIDGTDLYTICYGGKKSGKTFTLEGCFNAIDFTNAGVIPRSINGLIENLKTKGKYTIRVSYVQIEEDTIIDLLSDGKNSVFLKEPTKKFNNQLGGVMYVCATELTVTESTTSQVFSKLNILRKERKLEEIEKLENVCRVFSITIISSEEEKRGQKDYINCGRMTFVDLPCCNSNNPEGSLLNALNFYVDSSREQRMKINIKNNDITRILQEVLGGQGYLIAIGCLNDDKEDNTQTLSFLSKLKSIKNVPTYTRHILKSVYDAYLDEEIKQLNYQYSDLLRKNVISKEALEAKKLQQEIQSQRYANVQIGSLIQRVRKESEPEYKEINKKIQIANEYITKKKRTEAELREKISEMVDLAKKIEGHNQQLEEMIQKQIEESERQKEYIERSVKECKIDGVNCSFEFEKGEKKIFGIMEEISKVLSGEECRKVEVPKYASMNEIIDMLNGVVYSFKEDGDKTIRIIEDVLKENESKVEEFGVLISKMIERLKKGKSRWSGFEDKVIEEFGRLIEHIKERKRIMEDDIEQKEKLKKAEMNEIRQRKMEMKKEMQELIPQMNKDIENILNKYKQVINKKIKESKDGCSGIGREIHMEESLESFGEDISNKIMEVKKQLDVEIKKNEGEEEELMEKMKLEIEKEKMKERFAKECFKESIEKTKIAIQKIFDESGVIDFIEEQCKLLEIDDNELREKHTPLKDLFQQSVIFINELQNSINELLNQFVEKINQITIDYESEIIIERIQSPMIPSILMQNSEYPTVLEELDPSKLVSNK